MTALITVAFTAPIVGIDRPRKTLHAIDMEHVVSLWTDESRRVTTDAVCGTRVRPFGFRHEDDVLPAPWPPAVKGLPWERCRTCFAGTTEEEAAVRVAQEGRGVTILLYATAAAFVVTLLARLVLGLVREAMEGER